MKFLILLALLLVTPVKSFASCGVASWYGGKFHNNLTASGERYNKNAMTAAHKTLPFGSRVKVTRMDTGQSVVVRINDRGPFIKGRVIDLSEKAAILLGTKEGGLKRVCLKRIR